MSNPLVSCLMPTRNRPDLAALAIRQFFAQTYSPAELIVIEDGEPHVPPCKAHHGDKVKRFYRFEGTIGAKLNQAAEQARGSYCIRWDDDDWNHTDRIAFQVKQLQHSGRGMVGLTSMVFYTENAAHAWEYYGDAAAPLGTSQAFRTDWLRANPVIDASMAEDAACSKLARDQGELHTVAGYRHLIVARDHASNTGRRSEDEIRASPYCESFQKIELGDWYERTVAPWVAAREAVA